MRTEFLDKRSRDQLDLMQRLVFKLLQSETLTANCGNFWVNLGFELIFSIFPLELASILEAKIAIIGSILAYKAGCGSIVSL